MNFLPRRFSSKVWFVASFLTLSIFETENSLAQSAEPITLTVDSSAFMFSPGNWTGDKGRAGAVFRQSWYPGAYFRVTWSTTNDKPTAQIHFDTSMGKEVPGGPEIAYEIDGAWVEANSIGDHLDVAKLKRAGTHTITVYFKDSPQAQRWGSPDQSPKNVLRVTGIELDAGSKPVPATINPRWVWIIGDSITEGIAANTGSDQLAAWSYFVGKALQSIGYEYGISACGWSGWLRPGDGPAGDVPAFYMVTGSHNGTGGTYDDTKSRWNKIDGNGHSLLDSSGHLSAYGGTGQEPSLILINYGTNDAFNNVNVSDLQASIRQSLEALRKTTPLAQIVLIVPFSQCEVKVLQDSFAAYRTNHPDDQHVEMIDLGPGPAAALGDNGFYGGLHPNLRGHAVLASEILARLLTK